MSNFVKLENALENLGYKEDKKIDKFQKYMEGVIDWNEKVNLTNITEEDEFIEKHYIDSVIIASEKEFQEAKRVIDVGTGGGFPGVPLAILHPEKEFFLLDSLNKRLKIIDQLTEEITIENVITVHGRAEDLGQNEDMRETFDLCISRAVANLTSLSELCLPFVKVGGYFIAYKGPGLEDELKDAEKAIKILGGQVDKTEDVKISDGMDHKLLFVKKVKNTPKKYPRKPGEPTRNPIK